jgi:hypothetical protein
VYNGRHMRLSIRAHFDGRVIVPDEPLDIPTNQPLRVEFDVAGSSTEANGSAARDAAVERIRSRAIKGLSIPLDALRRESIYGDD